MDEENGQNVLVKSKRGKNWWAPVKNGELNDRIPDKGVKAYLGDEAVNIVVRNEKQIKARDAEIRRLQREIKKGEESSARSDRLVEHLRAELEWKQTERDRLERENKDDRGIMSLKDRIKEIFKKHDFTAVTVLTAVGAVIGAIIANLKHGLATLWKGMGNALKDLGKKLGQTFPGMIGTIGSFIFRTAGEVLGFLAKHAWLLIVAVVIYATEQFKKKRS